MLNLEGMGFSGWSSLEGLSDATPDLATNGTMVFLFVKGTGGDYG